MPQAAQICRERFPKVHPGSEPGRPKYAPRYIEQTPALGEYGALVSNPVAEHGAWLDQISEGRSAVFLLIGRFKQNWACAALAGAAAMIISDSAYPQQPNSPGQPASPSSDTIPDISDLARPVRTPPATGQTAGQVEHVDKEHIGHLETQDDIGINWLFFNCDRQGSSMACEVFQTLINREVEPKDKAAAVQKKMEELGSDPVAGFRLAFGKMCSIIPTMLTAAETAVRTGIGVNGKPVNSDDAKNALAMFSHVGDACRDTSSAGVRRFEEFIIDQKTKTCRVHSDRSQQTFHLDSQTGKWVSQEGPAGACGSITIGVLEKDESSHSQFWIYTEKRVRTNPNGPGIPGLLSCKNLPEYTFHYTWRTTPKFLSCDSIESLPD